MNNEKADGTQKHPFSADRPITSRAKDLLGRADFSESLASSIRSWKGNDSLVIALYGPWGSGKSSVKNMVLESLRKNQKDCPLIVEFNPWQWTGQDQLAEGFFQEIGLALGRIDTSKTGKKRAAKWRAYGAYLKTGSFLVESLRKVIVYLLVIIAAAGVGGAFIEAQWFKSMRIALGIVSLILVPIFQWGETLAENIASAFEARSKALQKGAAELKDELAELLLGLSAPVLVIMDDVDRLSTDEIKLLFQLVKANADFPNLIYLLVFQRDIVEKSLEAIAPIAGREFLEKIVQVGFDIPRIERPRLERVLFAGLDELLGEGAAGQRFNQRRWGNIFSPGLRPYFETLRDVHRFLATLSFHVNLFGNNGSFEVNPIDLIALEVLRVFEPAVYHRLPEAKSLLTGQRGLLRTQQAEGETRRVMESIVDNAAESNRPQVREILKQLFPPAGWVFDRFPYSGGSEEAWFRDLRVCHPDVFDRYFHLTIPEGDISQAELEHILSLVNAREGLVTEFRVLNQRGILGVALDRLEAYKEKIDLQHAVPFVTALFDIGDELPYGPMGLFSDSPELHASRIIHWYLKQEKDPRKRAQILKEAMKATTGLYLPILKISIESRKQEGEGDPDAFIVADGDLGDLQKICVEKIERAAGSGGLKTHPKMQYILYRWKEWASPEAPKKWVEELIESDDGLLSFLTAFLQQSQSYGEEDYVAQRDWHMSLENIENFVSVDSLAKKVGQLSPTGLGDKEQRALHAFQKALKQRQEGKSDDD